MATNLSRDVCENNMEIQAWFTSIVEHDAFRSAPIMRTLLVYLWNHKTDTVSEFAVAVDALGRPDDFDPKTDASVRVLVSRLRSKLKEFDEQTEGTHPLVLSIPKGGHQLQWSVRISPPSDAVPPKARPSRLVWALTGTVIALAAALMVLFIEVRSLRAVKPIAAAALPPIWKSFLAGGKPVHIVVPSPTYFNWQEHHIIIRDLSVPNFRDYQNSPFLKELASKWGPPSLGQYYVGAVEMMTAVNIMKYLERAGQTADIVESARFAADAFTAQNTIALGMPRTAEYLAQLTARTNFYLAAVDPDVVRNRNPLPGERTEFNQVKDSEDHSIYPGIIISLPIRPERTRTLLLVSQYPNGLTPLLVTVEGQRALEEVWRKGGAPDGWEMVVEAEIFRETALRSRPVAFRAIPDSFWKE